MSKEISNFGNIYFRKNLELYVTVPSTFMLQVAYLLDNPFRLLGVSARHPKQVYEYVRHESILGAIRPTRKTDSGDSENKS